MIISLIDLYINFISKIFLWISDDGYINLNMLYLFQEFSFRETIYIWNIYFLKDYFENANSYPQKYRIAFLIYKVSFSLFKSKNNYL